MLQEIILWHKRGTRYNIHMDENDGLLFAGDEGVQLTWMDAKVDNWVVTSRIGKPVEINALWFNALNIMVEFAHLLGEDGSEYETLIEKVKAGFSRFWNAEMGCCHFAALHSLDARTAAQRGRCLRPSPHYGAWLTQPLAR